MSDIYVEESSKGSGEALCTIPLPNELYKVFEGSSESRSEKSSSVDVMT